MVIRILFYNRIKDLLPGWMIRPEYRAYTEDDEFQETGEKHKSWDIKLRRGVIRKFSYMLWRSRS